MQTMGRWAEGWNALTALPPERRQAAEPVIETALARLRRHGSLGELAAAYYADADWFGHLADEFALPVKEREAVRAAAHWARLMEIRHPHARRDTSPRRRSL